MTVQIAGIQRVDFNDIHGTNLFCLFADEHVNGHRTDKFFIKDSIPLPDLKPGDKAHFEFDRKGKVVDISK